MPAKKQPAYVNGKTLADAAKCSATFITQTRKKGYFKGACRKKKHSPLYEYHKEKCLKILGDLDQSKQRKGGNGTGGQYQKARARLIAVQCQRAEFQHEVEAGNKIEAWTLDWDEDSGVLRKMRSKETEADYRYFREPDLLPVVIDEKELSEILSNVPELPLKTRARFMEQYAVPEYDAEVLTAERSLAEYFETAVLKYDGDPKRVSNWLMNDVLRIMNDLGVHANELMLTPDYLAEIIKLVDTGTVNKNTGKSLLEKVQSTGKSPVAIVEDEGLA